MFDVATTRTLNARASAAHTRRWTWPLPRLDDAPPLVLRSCAPEKCHVEVGYATRVRPHRFLPVFASQDGVVTYAGKGEAAGAAAHALSICLDHAGGWSTRYGGLVQLLTVPTDRFVKRRRARVRAGDVLGYVSGARPMLHFELWRLDDEDYAPIDPADRMNQWAVIPWSRDPVEDATGLVA